jgi:hypothetical protein
MKSLPADEGPTFFFFFVISTYRIFLHHLSFWLYTTCEKNTYHKYLYVRFTIKKKSWNDIELICCVSMHHNVAQTNPVISTKTFSFTKIKKIVSKNGIEIFIALIVS